jgi:hypothetical protein
MNALRRIEPVEIMTEWVAKAEGDYATAGRELRARRHPNYDAACFHAQQTGMFQKIVYTSRKT